LGEQKTQPGFDWGYHGYDAYHFAVDSIRFFRLQKPFSLLSYNQGARQTDAQLHALMARPLANDVSLIIEYRRTNDLSAANHAMLGTFDYNIPGGQDRNLHIGIGYQPKKRAYKGFYSYLGNTYSREETGGLTNPYQLEDPRSGRSRLSSDPFIGCRRETRTSAIYRQSSS
jgi:hypothetical protein